ncbi:MAG TPA: ABC transporter permease [Acidimicrobiia bacterium]|jgi:peptide/nickel transport system permease protein|nr:ABC transporter permease [Acidimicrobiia bacterium]
MWFQAVRAERAPRVLRDTPLKVKARRLWGTTTEVFSRGSTAFGAILIVLMLGMAIFAPLIVDVNPRGAYQMPRDLSAVAAPPGTEGHPLGTTRLGGDVLYGIVWGARLSLQLSIYVVAGAVLMGLIVGSTAGILGGKVDAVLMRLVDVFLSIPTLVFPLAIAAILGPSFINIVVALAAIMWARYARITRSQILQVREEDYVDAARTIGDSKLGIIRRDILPNSFTPVAVQATLDMGHAVLLGATLAFIGLAVAGQAEWGTLVSEGQADIVAGRWWTSTFPGAMVFLWALSFNLVGDGLRDVLDPRTEGR